MGTKNGVDTVDGRPIIVELPSADSGTCDSKWTAVTTPTPHIVSVISHWGPGDYQLLGPISILFSLNGASVEFAAQVVNAETLRNQVDGHDARNRRR